jgi:hypothetical protein
MLAVTRNSAYIPNSPILSTPMMEVIRSSETFVLTRATWHHSPEDGVLHFDTSFAQTNSMVISLQANYTE